MGSGAGGLRHTGPRARSIRPRPITCQLANRGDTDLPPCLLARAASSVSATTHGSWLYNDVGWRRLLPRRSERQYLVAIPVDRTRGAWARIGRIRCGSCMSALWPGIEVGIDMGRLPSHIPIVRIGIMTVLSALLVVNHYVAAPQDAGARAEASDAGYLHEIWSAPRSVKGGSGPRPRAPSKSILIAASSPVRDIGVEDRQDTSSSPSRPRREPGGGSRGSTGSTTTDGHQDGSAAPAGRPTGTTATAPGAASPSRGREVAAGRRSNRMGSPKPAAHSGPRNAVAAISKAAPAPPERSVGRKQHGGENLPPAAETKSTDTSPVPRGHGSGRNAEKKTDPRGPH
jgi:hypothetical protein